MPILDIIVTHYNEPESVYGKFFSMLALQRGVDFNDIRVIVVNDGEECRIPDEFFDGMPYRVDNFTITHAGVSAARNHGIKNARAEWISFSDCDDMYTTVYSLKLVIDILKDKTSSGKLDMLWTKLCAEDRGADGELKLIMRGLNLVFIHGKYYRREFIVRNCIEFPEDQEFNEDSCFNAVANTIWDHKRTAEIKTDMPIYSWCYRPGSLTGTPENLDKAVYGSYQRNKKVCEATKERLPYDRYCAMVARTVFDTYYVLNLTNGLSPLRKEMLNDFKKWFAERRADFWNCDRKYMREIKAVSRAEYSTGLSEQSTRWPGTKSNPCNESISVTQWLRNLEEDTE